MRDPQAATVREAVPDDAQALTHLHIKVWEDAYGSLMPTSFLKSRSATIPERIKARRQSPDGRARTIVAAEADRLVGFASVGNLGQTT